MRLKFLTLGRLGFHIILFAGLLHATPPTTSQWDMIFQDEFDGTVLDSTKWGRSFGGDKYFLQDSWAVDENVAVADGKLILSATKKPSHGLPYSTGVANTKGKFTYKHGYIEFKMKPPKGMGFVTLIQLVTEKQELYMNILENPAHLSKYALMVLYVNAHTNLEYTGTINFYEDFHVYGMEWDAGKVIWTIDGVERGRNATNIVRFTDPVYIRLGMFVGNLDWQGIPDATTPWPGLEEFEYIRVYKVKTVTALDDASNQSPRANWQFIAREGNASVMTSDAWPKGSRVELRNLNGGLIQRKAVQRKGLVDLGPCPSGVKLLTVMGGGNTRTQRVFVP